VSPTAFEDIQHEVGPQSSSSIIFMILSIEKSYEIVFASKVSKCDLLKGVFEFLKPGMSWMAMVQSRTYLRARLSWFM
jgi:hypothetical protein